MANEAAVDWRQQVADRLMAPAEAMQIVKPGDIVWMGGLSSTPIALCQGLTARTDELADVTVCTALTPFDWDRPELCRAFTIRTIYTGPLERKAAQEGRFEYVPVAGFREGRMPAGWDFEYDVAAIPISPPDDDGYCSFGNDVLFGPTVMSTSKRVVGEIHPNFIRTGGQNRVHISKFDRLTLFEGQAAPVPIAPRSQETIDAAEVICALTAFELIPDRSTLQIGTGDVSAAMCLYLGDRHDLGIHTEMLPAGIVDLVDQGVVTGKYKAVHPGKVVASFTGQIPPEELARIDGHPAFEFYDFNHTDDMRLILQFDNFVAINNALFVDLTGNVCAETWGPLPYTGTGGQATFAYAGHVTNRHSIIVLPSSQLVSNERRPRIVPMLPEGSTITSHRAFVDYVVTEQGIAKLSGKSLSERIAELISVAHPDFRADLRKAAANVYNLSE
jgi:4-hydroxybutyrate CoA-transferase